MRKILLNASMVTKSMSGVGVYSIQIVKQLVLLLEANHIDFDLFCYHHECFHSSRHLKKISLGFLGDTLLLKKITLHRHLWNIVVLNFIGRKYDLIYSPSSHGTLFHPKQIITIHDVICLSFPDSHKGQYYYFKYFLPFLIKRSKQIISISNFTKNEVIGTYTIEAKKISVIYNGIDHLENLKWFEQDESWLEKLIDDSPFCLCVGASYPHKNIETLLAVCEKMKGVNVKFLIVNKPNPYYNRMMKKVDDLELKNVIFLPFINSSRLGLLYRRARLNIYLSLYEGFGFPPAEAAFFGTQSLLSKQPALVEIYGEGFEYTDPYDVNRIKHIVLIYTSVEKKVETNSYPELKIKYNWKNAAERTLNLLTDSLK